jgi:predicted dehydrogenase
MTVAVLGLGSIGFRHARNLIELGEQPLGYDPVSENVQRLVAQGGIAAASREEALATAKIAIIASPTNCHLDDLRVAIDAGCHVFLEKPIAHKVDGLKDIFESAARTELVVFAGLSLRYHPCVEMAKALLGENRLGQILWARLLNSSYLPSWRPNSDYRKGYAADAQTGGVIFDDIHEIDLANYLLGPAAVVACAARSTGALSFDAEDCADVILSHEGGHQSTIHMDFASPVRQRRTEIVGTEGVLRLDISRRHLELLDKDGNITQSVTASTELNDDYLDELRSFLACIDGMETPRCEAEEAISVLTQVIKARSLAGLPNSDDQ